MTDHCSMHQTHEAGCSPCVAIAALTDHWRCVRCAYVALSSPFEDFTDEHGIEGTAIHSCPACGDSYWKFAGSPTEASVSPDVDPANTGCNQPEGGTP